MLDAIGDAVVADYGAVSGPDWYEGAARRIARQVGGGLWIAVLHSRAGGFAPALATEASDLAGFIFADAVLPYPGQSVLGSAPPSLVRRFDELTVDGTLAPWNEWFEPDPTLFMIPDPAFRARFIAGLPRVPHAFLEAPSPSDVSWERLPAAYLQLSEAYADEADEAARRGWPVRRAPLHHLAMASSPALVASPLKELLAELC